MCKVERSHGTGVRPDYKNTLEQHFREFHLTHLKTLSQAMETHINIQTVTSHPESGSAPHLNTPLCKRCQLTVNVCTTHPQYQVSLIHSYTWFCNTIRIWHICQCFNKMRAAFGTNYETDYISYISAWEKLLKFKMLELTEKQEISWGISASRNLIAQLKNNWYVSRCSMKSALINSVRTLQGSELHNKTKILWRKLTLKTQFVCVCVSECVCVRMYVCSTYRTAKLMAG